MPINLGIGVSELCRMQGFDAVHITGLLADLAERSPAEYDANRQVETPSEAGGTPTT